MSTVSDWEHKGSVSQHLLTIDLKLQPRTPRYGLMSTGQCRLLTIYDKIILVNSTLIFNFNLIATSMEMSMKYLRHSLTAHII